MHEDEILQTNKGDDNLEVKLVKTEDDYGFFFQVQVCVDGVCEKNYDYRNIELAQDKYGKIYKEF